MYRPPAFDTDLDAAHDLIDAHPLAQLVVVADGAPLATPVPLIRRGDALVGHLARPNRVWRHEGPALAIFTGVDAYVSPRWYEGKAIDGKVVPTWNYTTVHVHGRLVVHDDAGWVRQVVADLTDRMESGFAAPWAIDDAPGDYLEGMLRAIVGIELVDLQIVGKAKLSQNRSATDQRVVADGLADRSARERAVAEAMQDSGT